MANDTYTTYSSKGINVGTTGLKYGVNEMTETAVSMHLQDSRRSIVEGITSDIESDFLQDMVSDGLNAGLGYFSGQAMQLQEAVLEKSYAVGATLVASLYAKSSLKDKFKKFRKGRKASMFSKFLSATPNDTEKARLIADFTSMDMQGSASSHNPMSRQKRHEAKYLHESLEVNKEATRTRMAQLNITGLRDTFEMKIRTSSFFNTDKKLIKTMTGLTTVTDKDIKKLNTLSNSQVFQDSDGNWIGGNEAMITLMSGLGIHRAK